MFAGVIMSSPNIGNIACPRPDLNGQGGGLSAMRGAALCEDCDRSAHRSVLYRWCSQNCLQREPLSPYRSLSVAESGGRLRATRYTLLPGLSDLLGRDAASRMLYALQRAAGSTDHPIPFALSPSRLSDAVPVVSATSLRSV